MIRICSTGIVTAHGRGMAALEKALHGRWREPQRVLLPGSGRRIPAFQVPDEILKDRQTLKGMRRADRLSRMAVTAAVDAWAGSGLAGLPPERVGVLLSTGLGPHVRTFGFLDGILDFGDSSASPTDFSHSVHNAAAGYIAARLQIHGPVQTVTDFDFAFQQALNLARCWLREGRCDAVLTGAVEELGEVMLHVCSRMLDVPADGRPRQFEFSSSPKAVPGEGAVFFALVRPDAAGPLPLLSVQAGPAPDADMTILDAEGMSGPETEYQRFVTAGATLANYVPVFGSMMTGAAFQCAIAARMIEREKCYAGPLQDGGHYPCLCGQQPEADIESINCLKRGKDGCWQNVHIRRSPRTGSKQAAGAGVPGPARSG